MPPCVGMPRVTAKKPANHALQIVGIALHQDRFVEIQCARAPTEKIVDRVLPIVVIASHTVAMGLVNIITKRTVSCALATAVNAPQQNLYVAMVHVIQMKIVERVQWTVQVPASFPPVLREKCEMIQTCV